MQRLWRYIETIYTDHGWIAAVVTGVVIVAAIVAVMLLTGVDFAGLLERLN